MVTQCSASSPPSSMTVLVVCLLLLVVASINQPTSSSCWDARPEDTSKPCYHLSAGNCDVAFSLVQHISRWYLAIIIFSLVVTSVGEYVVISLGYSAAVATTIRFTIIKVATVVNIISHRSTTLMTVAFQIYKISGTFCDMHSNQPPASCQHYEYVNGDGPVVCITNSRYWCDSN